MALYLSTHDENALTGLQGRAQNQYNSLSAYYRNDCIIEHVGDELATTVDIITGNTIQIGTGMGMVHGLLWENTDIESFQILVDGNYYIYAKIDLLSTEQGDVTLGYKLISDGLTRDNLVSNVSGIYEQVLAEVTISGGVISINTLSKVTTKIAKVGESYVNKINFSGKPGEYGDDFSIEYDEEYLKINAAIDAGIINSKGLSTAGGLISTLGGNITTSSGNIITGGGYVDTRGGRIYTQNGDVSIGSGSLITNTSGKVTFGSNSMYFKYKNASSVGFYGGSLSIESGDINTKGNTIYLEGGEISMGGTSSSITAAGTVASSIFEIRSTLSSDSYSGAYSNAIGGTTSSGLEMFSKAGIFNLLSWQDACEITFMPNKYRSGLIRLPYVGPGYITRYNEVQSGTRTGFRLPDNQDDIPTRVYMYPSFGYIATQASSQMITIQSYEAQVKTVNEVDELQNRVEVLESLIDELLNTNESSDTVESRTLKMSRDFNVNESKILVEARYEEAKAELRLMKLENELVPLEDEIIFSQEEIDKANDEDNDTVVKTNKEIMAITAKVKSYEDKVAAKKAEIEEAKANLESLKVESNA